MTKIVVNGDSYVHERHFAIDDSYIEKTWAYKLGAKNIALAGSSNERIFYSTIDYLNNYQPEVLIIGWTGNDRFMLPHTNGLHLHITPGSTLQPFFDNFITAQEDLNEFQEIYYRKMYSPFINFQRFITFHKHLEKYCDANGIKYLNFMTINSLPNNEELMEIAKTAYMSKKTPDIEQKGIEYNLKILKNGIASFNSDKWINKQIGFCYEDQVKNFPRWQDGHPGLEASAFWLDIIKKNLT